MSSGIRKLDELLIRTLRNAQEHSKKALKDPDIGPEAREILGNGIMEIEDQIRDLEGGSTKHAKGGAVMKKRGGTFKGTF